MFLFIKDAILIGISVVTALLVSVGLLPGNAVAPDVTPPAVVIQTEEPKPTVGTPPVVDTKPEEPVVEEEPTTEDTEPTPTQEEAPVVDGAGTALQEALDALAELQNQQTISPSNLNDTVRNAVVNVLCTTSGAGPLNPISASGVIIDPRGIILTNAHVAQYFLLKDYPSEGFIECVIRTGSPAKPAYTVELLFISPSWVLNNAQKIDDENPTGNGEYDYALLRVTGFINAPGIAVPAEFPHLPIALNAPKLGDATLVAGYPAGFLGGITVQKDLYAASANTSVEQLYTFGTNTVDLFSIGGSVVAQQGASGGAVARNDGALVGIVVTASSAPQTANRELRALTTEYILRAFLTERGIPLEQYLSLDLTQEKATFESTTRPTLSAALISVLAQ